MTLGTDLTKNAYAGTGAQIAFPVTFIFWQSDDLMVILRDAAGVEVTWVRGTQYTITGGLGAAGELTVNTAPTDYTPQSGETLVIASALPNTQPTGVPLGGDLPSAAIEQQFDQTVRQIQQQAETIGRQLAYPISDAVTLSSELPNSTLRASTFLAFDAQGEPIAAAGSVGTVPISTFMETLLDDTSAAAGRATLNAQDDVITTRGDIIVGDATPVPARLAKGAANLLVGADSNDITYFGGTLAKSANYTVVVGDHRKLILVDATAGPITITLLPVATAGDDFSITVKKADSSVNAVTIDADGTETIDGSLTRVITRQYTAFTVVSDGTEWFLTQGSASGSLIKLASVTASASATVEFTDLDSTYDEYRIVGVNVLPANDDVEFRVRLSTDNGATFISTASAYRYGITSIITADHMVICAAGPGASLSNVASDYWNGKVTIWNPSGSGKTYIFGEYQHLQADGTALVNHVITGFYNTAAATNAIQLFMESGNISEGEFRLYGVQK